MKKRVSRDQLKADCEYLLSRLKAYETVVHEDGTFTVVMGRTEDDAYIAKLIRHNHLRCMLRRDYIQDGRALRGTQLERLIDGYLVAMAEASGHIIGSNPDHTVQMAILEGTV